MKKIYSVALILFSLWAPSLTAQNACPNGSALPIKGATSCYILIQGAIPNGQISVFNSSNQIISTVPAPFTDASGMGFVFYDCNSSPAVVLVVNGSTVCFPAISSAIGLPIKVKSFTAQSQTDNSVLLRWTSVFEANSSKYIIQRSADGRNFTDISEVKAAGNSVTAINYSYADRQMANGAAYYRLKLIDIDGSFDYTKIIYINNGQAGLIPLSVFPNPFRSEVQLKGVSATDVNSKNIRVYNAMGSEVNYRVIGGNSIVIDPALPKGVYVLRLKGEIFKLFKE
jgi:Secretion system C-terminal sorting domain